MATSTVHLSRQFLVGELIRRAAHRNPNKEAFVFEEKKYSFIEMEKKAVHFAGWLQANGVSRNDKVGFLLKNGMTFVEVFYGTALSGAIGVPINLRLSEEEIEYIVKNSGCNTLIIDKEFEPIVMEIKKRNTNIKNIVVDSMNTVFSPYNSIYEQSVTYIPCEQLNDDNGCMILYTSGTTGKPKGAILTHKNFVQNSMNLLWEMKPQTNSKQLVATPFFHLTGLMTPVMVCLLEGTCIIHSEFNPINILKTIEEEQVDLTLLVPAMWKRVLQEDNIGDYNLSSMEICMTAGSICPIEIKTELKKYFVNAGIVDVFGQTETITTTCLRPEDALRKEGSVGKPVINMEIRIVDDNMKDVEVGEVGEILYRGPTVMKEYYKNREATAEAFQGGWFHSGDLVRMDEEGFIYVVDRKKDMIISGGENIYPAELEEVLNTHPDILECAIIGVPDEDWGEKVKAYVVLKQGKTLTSEEVIQYVSDRLASYKKPKEVNFIDQLPRNATGKVLKRVLKEWSKKSEEENNAQSV